MMDYFCYFVAECRFQLRCPREITAKYLEPVCVNMKMAVNLCLHKHPCVFTQGLPIVCREPHTYSYVFLSNVSHFLGNSKVPTESLFKHTVCNNVFCFPNQFCNIFTLLLLPLLISDKSYCCILYYDNMCP